MPKILALAALLAAATAQASSTYYVSVSGRDTNRGTLAAPWRHIQHACGAIAGGDTVLVEGGTYNEQVTIKKPMVLENASGASPIIDGTGLAVPNSDAGLVLINNVSNVTVAGFEVRNYKTTNSNLVPAGMYVEGAEADVVLRGNTVDHIQNTGTNASQINAFGIAVYGNSPVGEISNLTIEENQVYDTVTGNSETVTVDGNVNGFLITGNRVHDVNNIGIDCIGFEGVSPIAGQDQARNGTVSWNVVYNVTSLHNPAYGGQQSADGIYVDGGTDIVIEQNEVHNADIGIEVASEHSGHVSSNVTVRNNLDYYCNLVGLSIGGYASTVGGTSNCTFVNNTFYENDTTISGSGEFQIQYHTSGNVFKNNILNASAQGIFISEATTSSPGLSSDYNLYYTASAPSWSWGSGTYGTLASLQAGAHEDLHSKFGSPLFANLSNKNFQLETGSPGINAGADLGSSVVGTEDLAGHARLVGAAIDIGCYEH